MDISTLTDKHKLVYRLYDGQEITSGLHYDEYNCLCFTATGATVRYPDGAQGHWFKPDRIVRIIEPEPDLTVPGLTIIPANGGPGYGVRSSLGVIWPWALTPGFIKELGSTGVASDYHVGQWIKDGKVVVL